VAVSRGARFVLVFVLFAVAVSMSVVVATYLVATRGPRVESRSVLWLRVPSDLVERVPNDIVGQLMAGRRDTVESVVDALRKAKVDDRVQAVVVVPPIRLGLWGKLQEIRDAMLDFKESGKPLVSYLEYGGGQQYYLATAADKIFLTPSSPLDLVGVASYDVFLRDALDLLGVHPDMLHAGEFKTASNLYTETTFTPEHREMSQALNRDLYDQLVSGVADGRQMTEADVRGLIDEGPFLPETAVARGLVDGLVYEDELLAELGLDEEPTDRLNYSTYRQLDPSSLGLDNGPRLAVVYGVGAITFGGSGFDGTGGAVMGSEATARAIRSARDDDSIEAIVLRIDSPGGAAIASDIIWREVRLATEKKPVIASMSDVAASGGYYVAAPADVVVAQPGTLTGSIGVVAGKLAYGRALEKLGVNIEGVNDGAMSAMNSPFAPYSAETRERVQQQIDSIYETFLQRVAAGRDMTRDEVHAVGQGRVWTGRQAVDLGLVDELGGMRRAVELAKERAGIDSDRGVRLVAYPRPLSFFELVNNEFGLRASVAGWLASPTDRFAAIATRPMRLFRPGEPLALMSPLTVH